MPITKPTLYETYETDINGNKVGAALFSQILSQDTSQEIDGVLLGNGFPDFLVLSEDAKKLFIYLYHNRGKLVSAIDLCQIVKNLKVSVVELQESLQKKDAHFRIQKFKGSIYIFGTQGEIDLSDKVPRSFPRLEAPKTHFSPQMIEPQKPRAAYIRKTVPSLYTQTGKIADLFREGTILRKVFEYIMSHENTQFSFRDIITSFPDVQYGTLHVALQNIRERIQNNNIGMLLKTIERGVYIYTKKLQSM